MRWYWGVAFTMVATSLGCGGARTKPTMLEAKSNRTTQEVFGCVLAGASAEGYVPTNGGVNDAFLELRRGRENLGGTILTGQDMSYDEGLTVTAAAGIYRLQVYRVNANATANNVRYSAMEGQLTFANDLWESCTTAREECLEIQSDYQQCLDRGGVDPTK